jgi:hypothetical protein
MLRPTVSLSWNKTPIWGLRPDLYYCQIDAGLLMWGALSDERTGLSFKIAAGPRDHTVFYSLRFETYFSSPPRTRRAMVEVFDPTSTRDRLKNLSLLLI